ncbi:MAG: hypothetical protein JWN34_3679 [Bryobacterales bacterium]|nr:hypothetical protein [Bryobacterales bacterium]
MNGPAGLGGPDGARQGAVVTHSPSVGEQSGFLQFLAEPLSAFALGNYFLAALDPFQLQKRRNVRETEMSERRCQVDLASGGAGNGWTSPRPSPRQRCEASAVPRHDSDS